MKFDFQKKCHAHNCIHKVWDACINNLSCFYHCECKENKMLKQHFLEYELALRDDIQWRLKERENSRNSR